MNKPFIHDVLSVFARPSQSKAGNSPDASGALFQFLVEPLYVE
jgi:hypothetical protein